MSLFARWTQRNAQMSQPCFPLAQEAQYPAQVQPRAQDVQFHAPVEQGGLNVRLHTPYASGNVAPPAWSSVLRPALNPPPFNPSPPPSLRACSEISPVWMQGSGLSDEDERVILEHLGSAIRDSTRKTYTGYWLRYKKFCEERNIAVLPSSPAVIARFLIFISELKASVAGAKIAVSAIGFFHKSFMGDSVSPTDSIVVKNVMKSLSEKFAKPVKKAKPFSSLILKDLLDFQFLSTNSSKQDDSIVIMAAVMFCLMARHEEVSKLTPECVKSLDTGDLEITFPSAKNYNFADAKKSFLASCPNAKYNIAEIFSNYVSSIQPGSLLFPLSYNVALVKVRQVLLKANVLQSQEYSLHSFRLGAVSEAVNGGLLSDSDVQRHARWKSLDMVYRYRCQNLDSQLKASRILLISRI